VRLRGRPLLLLAALLLLTATGCSGEIGGDRDDARKGGSVLVGLAAAPNSLDPARASNAEALQALLPVYTPPMTYRRAQGTAGTQVVPALADAAPAASVGFTTFRFRFRDGLRYGDGRALRASDLPRALRRARALNPAARRALAGVQDVETDDRTRVVRILLRAPDPSFPRVLAALWAAPVPAGTPTRDLSGAPPPGIGPYRLLGRRPGRAYVLARRRDFHLAGVPAGNVDSIGGVVVPDVARRTSLTLKGELDVSQVEPPEQRLPGIRSEEKRRYREFPTLSERYVRFDTERRPFVDQDLRQAVSYSLDLQTLTRLEDGFLEPSCNVLPSQVAGFVALKPCPYGDREGDADLVRGEQLVRRSGRHEGTVLVAAQGGQRSARLARYGVETLRKIGLHARVARTPAQRRRAQMTFARLQPPDPLPGAYLDAVDDAGVRSDAGVLERDGTVGQTASRWAALDERTVREAVVAPYGVGTIGVLASERLDVQNCLRFLPVYGTDLSSLCVQ
jgi:peptide/nickel transport system substrate-binding protein